MKCSIILDLLPLYEEGLCCNETKQFVREHLMKCERCRSIYAEMKQSLDLKTLAEENLIGEMPMRDEKFWYKYYQKLVVKGLILYLTAYFTITILGLVVKELLK